MLFVNVNWEKVINVFSVSGFVAISVWGVTFFLSLWWNLEFARQQEADTRCQLQAVQAELDKQHCYLERLKYDPALVERLLRKNFGYARTQEFIFRFK